MLVYKPGKADWLAHGLAVEKSSGEPRMVIDRMEGNIPTCHGNDSAAEIKIRAENAGFKWCPVINEEGVLLGVVREKMWQGDPTVRAAAIMDFAPTTIRPSYPVDDAVELLLKKNHEFILVTSSDGKLLGVFRHERNRREQQIPKSEIWA